MKKTLSVALEDVEKADTLTISGTQEDKFNTTVVLRIGQSVFAVNSQDLAQALACVVDFQTPVKPSIVINESTLFPEKYGV